MAESEEGATYDSPNLMALTAGIVSNYVTNNPVPQQDLIELILDVHVALETATNNTPTVFRAPLVPAVPIKQSVTPEFIVCLEDGKKFKFLTRHLKTKFNLTPAEYRRKWGLSADYPMVAPNYAQKRAEMAKAAKLGHRKR
ncbi:MULTISPECIES: MucR family transcriptional regulator [Roseibium]|jgi:predicted transcriptional regulator|uniref:Transcriptional regulator n=1 Tax=Roseibium aggregatum (strain ATCC 25650 / DSM 13394 / JCM 20685 / NBRC 16684 / NCIMB 2208 / IAM 12614 / B1) TaxID=384765 RepID=A0NNN4_ROSAI|nr:MucR family transcriptional regulator [Roseibium aggregatum]EAV45765.1 transcriptional regulator [Stappia aggregata IAM 12614] [Roseibium aggregatum IAM 12614]MEE4014539.1 MucR family transcriptional regulator [Roseibium sp. FZY0029]